VAVVAVVAVGLKTGRFRVKSGGGNGQDQTIQVAVNILLVAPLRPGAGGAPAPRQGGGTHRHFTEPSMKHFSAMARRCNANQRQTCQVSKTWQVLPMMNHETPLISLLNAHRFIELGAFN
jgi:hypothetical protein